MFDTPLAENSHLSQRTPVLRQDDSATLKAMPSRRRSASPACAIPAAEPFEPPFNSEQSPLGDTSAEPLLLELYNQYLEDRDSAGLILRTAEAYSTGTLERLATHQSREVRRASIVALCLIGGYECNATVGRAMADEDRAVRILAENGIRWLWRRDGNPRQQRELAVIIRLNTSKAASEAFDRADRLVDAAPTMGEAWNQRAISHFNLKRFTAAIGDCRQALELNPYHFAAAVGMGQCHIEKGEDHRALECFQRALGLNRNLEGVRACVRYLKRALEDR